MQAPNPFVIFHLYAAIDINTKISIIKSLKSNVICFYKWESMSHTNAILQNIPVASTATDAFEIAVLRIHGKERPTVTWKNRFFHCQWNVDILINKSRHLKKKLKCRHFDKQSEMSIILIKSKKKNNLIFWPWTI